MNFLRNRLPWVTFGLLAGIFLAFFVRSFAASVVSQVHAEAGTASFTGSTASFSATFTQGGNQPIRTAFGPLRLDYKSGPNAWTTGLLIREGDGNVTIGAGITSADFNSASKLRVLGVIESTTGGIKFPDGTTQTTAASAAVGGGWTDGGTSVYLTTGTDKVGIGTTSPAATLTVQDTPAANFYSQVRLLGFNDGVVGGSMIEGWADNGPGQRRVGRILFGMDDGSADPSMDSSIRFFNTQASTLTEAMRISTTGSVGIGSTAPGAKLDVVGSGGGTVDLKVNGRITTGDAGGGGGIWLNNDASGFVGNNGGNIGFYTSGAGVGWNAFQIVKSSGNVGIGSTAPGAKLEVAGNINSSTGALQTAGVTRIDNSGVGTLAAGTTVGGIAVCTGAPNSSACLKAVGTGTGSTGTASIYFLNSSGTTTGRFDTIAEINATGGTITTSGVYRIHTFTSSGTFTPANAGNVEYLVVGGGGGGGGQAGGGVGRGGGGAGGFRTGTGLAVTAQGYTVTVGGGGAGGVGAADGTAGSSSVFSTITSAGGGFGAGVANGTSGGGGGSGGGGVYSGASGGAGTNGQGNNGGAGTTSTTNYGGGGGGGASAVGAAGTATTGGNGGAGTASSITGSSVTYAGGGGGGTYGGGTPGSGGAGGGGAGATSATATSGTANTGGGGGGSGGNTPGNGGAGGSGIVIIRYPTYGTLYLGSTNTSSADLAEYYISGDDSITAGDVVAISNVKVQMSNENGKTEEVTSQGVLRKADKPYDSKLIGIISTNPGVIMGSVDGDTGKKDKRMLALSGRVPVKIDPESPPIAVGDFLTSSTKPGLAMKATKQGHVVGRALERWQPSSAQGSGGQSRIEAFLSLSYYMGQLTEQGDLRIFTADTIKANTVSTKTLDVGGVDVLDKLNTQQVEIDDLKRRLERIEKQ